MKKTIIEFILLFALTFFFFYVTSKVDSTMETEKRKAGYGGQTEIISH